MDILKEMGYGGAFIHSRVGLMTEYLGDDWFNLVESCIDYGRKIGIDIWIYDEDRWPSGIAGGKVTAKEENRTRRLQAHILTGEEAGAFEKKPEGFFPGEVLGAFRARLTGHEYRCAAVWRPGDVLEPEESLIVIVMYQSKPSDVYNGNTYLDTMKTSAVDDFITFAYDIYRRRLPGETYEGVAGMFTDEPHRGAYLCDFSEGNQRSVPYTESVFPLFEQRFGYKVEEHFMEIFFREEGKPYSRAAKDYLELLQELFLTGYMERIQEKCRREKKIFTGHLLQENTLSAQTCMIGSVMSGYEYMDIPGIDLLGENTDCWWIGKQLTSVAHQMDKKHCLTELFGATGWQMNFEQYKNVGDWQAIMGIDLFCPHLCWYSMQGENKRDYPASMFYQSAWHTEYRYMEDYFARIHMLTQGKPADCRLLVLNPVESVWARAYSGCFEWLDAKDEGILSLEEQYRDTCLALMKAGIDFDYGEERILAGHGRVREGRLEVGSCVYDKVLISGVETMRETTWKLLMAYVEQGGQLLIAGTPPERIEAEPDERMEKLTERAKRITLEAEDVGAYCRPEKEICSLDSRNHLIFFQTYRHELGLVVMLLNGDRKQETRDIALTIHEPGRLEFWNVRTGEVTDLDEGRSYDTHELKLAFAPGEEKIFVLRGQEEAGEQGVRQKEIAAASGKSGSSCKLAERQEYFEYDLSEENVAVLDMVKVYGQSTGALLSEEQEVLRADRTVRNILELPYRGGQMVQPWFLEKYYPKLLEQKWALRLEYTFQVQKIPKKISLAFEGGASVKEIYLNGSLMPDERTTNWIDPAFTRLALQPERLQIGENVLSLSLDYNREEGIEAVYLLGDFGVCLRKEESDERQQACICGRPRKLRAGDIAAQGFPFYSGRMTYYLKEPVKGSATVSMKEPGAALAVLHGEEDVIVAFPPFTADVTGMKSIELLYNRRNTFGPLHIPREYDGTYGPEEYGTEGQLWREDYQLYRQGLPEQIVLTLAP